MQNRHTTPRFSWAIVIGTVRQVGGYVADALLHVGWARWCLALRLAAHHQKEGLIRC